LLFPWEADVSSFCRKFVSGYSGKQFGFDLHCFIAEYRLISFLISACSFDANKFFLEFQEL
jgi:hypothetical protein